MMTDALCVAFVCVAALVVFACEQPVAGAQSTIEEHRLKGEVVLVVARKHEVGRGAVIAESGAKTLVVLLAEERAPNKAACQELAKCLRLACDAEVSVRKSVPAEFPPDAHTIVLASAEEASALRRLGVRFRPEELPGEGSLIAPLRTARGIAIVARTARGLLDGACTVLEETVGAAWNPPRMYDPADAGSYVLETTVQRTPKAVWTRGRFLDKPAIAVRGVYIGRAFVRDVVVDWCARNKINFLTVSTGRPLPMPTDVARRLKKVLRRAQQFGIKVVFLNMTHRLPGSGDRTPASSPEAIARSTALYVEQFERFHLGGMAWHTASEAISVNVDAAYRKRSRVEWEAEYFNSYYKAIRAKHPDAVLAMLMGWVYMNPASKVAKLLPKDTVAWVVPNTPIIDAACTDLDAYGAHFQHVWYWLYSTVSADGIYPMVKCDYLEKYCREALLRGHGLMPQSAFLSNVANMMYLAHAGWHGVVENEKFLADFGTRYYRGDPRMGELLVQYQAALKPHRLWTNNIHTRRSGVTLLPSEIATLRKTAELAIELGRQTASELIRDRLKTLAVTAIRCLVVREPDKRRRVAAGPGKPLTRDELLGLVREAKQVFASHYFGSKRDRFWRVILKIETDLKP
ncbi:MAG: hypothetical protein ACTSX8_09960 [Alphaproteobacteria bacterium]